MASNKANPVMNSVLSRTTGQSGYDSSITKDKIFSAVATCLAVVIVSASLTYGAGVVYGAVAAAGLMLAGIVGSIIMGFVTGLSRKGREGSPLYAMIFSFFEGLMLGGIVYSIGGLSVSGVSLSSPAIVALVGSILMFFTAMVLYDKGIIVVKGKLRAVLYMSLMGMFVLYLGSLIVALVTGYNFLYSDGPIPIIIGFVAIVLAALSLIDTFGIIDYVVGEQKPESMKWSIATAIVADLVFMYIEIVRVTYLLNR